MPRHNLKKYAPAQDSTAGYKTNAADEKAVVLNVRTRAIADETSNGAGAAAGQGEAIGCPCGCEGEPVGKKRTFLMGHDARLRGILIRAHLTDTPVYRFINGQPHDKRSALEDAKVYGDSFVKALKEAEKRRHELNKKVLQDAMGSKRLVKVGRWKYTGQVAAVFSTPRGDEYEIKYVTKTGQTKTVRVPANEAPLATAQSGEEVQS